MMRRALLSGNEAIARGAYEAGVKVAAAYPGTPSTEILENLAKYPGVDTQWSPSEKVALEVVAGASYAGVRALAAMKHVGVNVASDPLMTLSYTGIRGGLVLISADDPGMHSSQNEQDNRHYARMAKIPLLEPSDSGEARKMVKMAFQLSEEFDTPVILRTTTRISHSKSPVIIDDDNVRSSSAAAGFARNPEKLVMLPAFGRKRHIRVEERLKELERFSESFDWNIVEKGSEKVGIITSGVSYNYAKEVLPWASFLKLGMVYPIPRRKILEFAESVEKLIVMEELDPFLEDQIKALGINVYGKDVIPICGELSPDIIARSLADIVSVEHDAEEPTPVTGLPLRPPVMCPGCPHRGVLYVLKKLGVIVTGDIGCYTLGALPPLSAIDTCLCMGASISHAVGIDKALGNAVQGKVVAVIGDSTFYHSGIGPLMNAAYNKSSITVVILDNRTTAMTGGQDHPGTGRTLKGEETVSVDIKGLARSLGVKRVRTINPYSIEESRGVLKEEISSSEVSLVISSAPCMLLKGAPRGKPFQVDAESCRGCGICLDLGCPAIEWQAEVTASEEKKKGRAYINTLLCTGCDICRQVCPFDAISRMESCDD